MSVNTNNTDHNAESNAMDDNSVGRSDTEQGPRGSKGKQVAMDPNQLKKKSCFVITRVIQKNNVGDHSGHEDSIDDLDETNTEDVSSEILDTASKKTDIDPDPSSEDTVQSTAEDLNVPPSPSGTVALNNIDSAPQLLLAQRSNSNVEQAATDDKIIDTNQSLSRFKVVKIESLQPFHRGRWSCLDFRSPIEAEKVPEKEKHVEDAGSGNSSAASSVHYVPGVDDLGKNPLVDGFQSLAPDAQQSKAGKGTTKSIHSPPSNTTTGGVPASGVQPNQNQSFVDSSKQGTVKHNDSMNNGPVPVFGNGNQQNSAASSVNSAASFNQHNQHNPHSNQNGPHGTASQTHLQTGTPAGSTGTSGGNNTEYIPAKTDYIPGGPGSQQHGGPQHGGPQHGGPQHGGPQHGGPQHGGPQHGGPQHGGPQHGGPHNGGPHNGGPPQQPSASAPNTSIGGNNSASGQPQKDYSSSQTTVQSSNPSQSEQHDPTVDFAQQLQLQTQQNASQQPSQNVGDANGDGKQVQGGAGAGAAGMEGAEGGAVGGQEQHQEGSREAREPPFSSMNMRTQGLLAPPLLQMVNAMQPQGANNDESGASQVAIDNKIEQAMDLVKSHLMYAVREEVDVLKEQIQELREKNTQLELENQFLRQAANSDTIEQLEKRQGFPPPSSSTS